MAKRNRLVVNAKVKSNGNIESFVTPGSMLTDLKAVIDVLVDRYNHQAQEFNAHSVRVEGHIDRSDGNDAPRSGKVLPKESFSLLKVEFKNDECWYA